MKRDQNTQKLGELFFAKIVELRLTNGEALQSILQVALFILTEAQGGDELAAADALVEFARAGRQSLRNAKEMVIVGEEKPTMAEDADRFDWFSRHVADVLGLEGFENGQFDLRGAVDAHRHRKLTENQDEPVAQTKH